MPSRDIAKQIGDQGGDYVLALKGNQGTLCDDARLFLDDPAGNPLSTSTTIDGDHRRIETRTATVSTDIDWLQKDHQWPNLAAIGKVARTRAFKTKTSIETVLYLLSTPLEHVPKKLLDFFDEDMLQLFEIERFLFDHVIPRDREAL